jgi:hypothetical protein
MQFAELLEHLKRQPFQPFRLHVADGSRYDIPGKERLWLFRDHVLVGIPHQRLPWPRIERSVSIPLEEITGVEVLTMPAPSGPA